MVRENFFPIYDQIQNSEVFNNKEPILYEYREHVEK